MRIPLLLATALATFTLSADSTELLIARGQQALRQKNKEAALAHLSQAVTQSPDDPEANYYLGVVHHSAADSTKALPFLEKSYEINSSHIPYMYAYFLAAYHGGEHLLARNIVERHFGAEPAQVELRTKLLPLYLRDMDWVYAGKLCRINDLWWYNGNVEHKMVLLDLSSEWNGLGDVLQIIRYANHLHAQGAYVIAYVRQELVPLLALCPYLSRVVASNQPKPIHDLQFSLTTDRCTLAMKDTLYSPSHDVPYLYADQSRSEKWKQRLHGDTYKVGICFASTKMREYFSNNVIPGPRGMHAKELIPLLKTDNVQFVNLQLNEPAQMQLLQSHGVTVFPDLDHDAAFMDTAAIMKELDLVITVDTSIAHLAGGLGVPVWVMLPYAADFRWFSDRDDSPWYPTMRLFRQTRQGCWNDVIERVKKELVQRLNEESA